MAFTTRAAPVSLASTSPEFTVNVSRDGLWRMRSWNVFCGGNPLPGEWWYYLGGPMGCVFIGVGALLVRSLGVLVTGLGMISGQLAPCRAAYERKLARMSETLTAIAPR